MSLPISHILDAAIRGGLPARYDLPTPRDAVLWRHAANRFRRGNSAYAHLIFRLEGATIIIAERPTGTLTTANGVAPLSPEEQEIARLKKELGL